MNQGVNMIRVYNKAAHGVLSAPVGVGGLDYQSKHVQTTCLAAQAEKSWVRIASVRAAAARLAVSLHPGLAGAPLANSMQRGQVMS